MTDLIVDVEILTASERTLSTLKSDFDDIEERQDDTANIWCSEELRSAMEEFATNMHHHRKELSQKIADCGTKVSATLDAWEEADRKLEEELRKNTSESPEPTR